MLDAPSGAPVTTDEIRKAYGDKWQASIAQHEVDPYALTPLKDRIVVKLTAETLKTAIHLPEGIAFAAPTRKGTVIAIGKGKRYLPNGEERECMYVSPGDEVEIGHHHDWMSQDGQYVICQEMDVRGIRRANGRSK